MRTLAVPLLLVSVLLIAAVGCGDDPVEPDQGPALADLLGAWEMAWYGPEGVRYNIWRGISFFYVASTGESCSMNWSDFGFYEPGHTGRIEESAWQYVEYTKKGDVVWDMKLNADRDSIFFTLAEPDSNFIKWWAVGRPDSFPAPPCIP